MTFPWWSSILPRTLVFPRPDDFHVHLRQGEGLAAYARREARSFGRALVMPNTLPPLSSPESLASYCAAILEATAGLPFVPLLSFKLLPGMTRQAVLACAAAGALVGKYYPAGATTNAQDGIREPREIAEALAAMEEADLILSIHGEDPEAPALEREAAFLPVAEGILAAYPRLRLILEHLSSKEGLAFVQEGPERLAGTLTAHHLLLSLDDLLGEGLEAHLFCKPVLKPRSHRDALRAAAFSGQPRLFFGSDSAPHPRAKKESGRAPAGIYSAPTGLPALAGLFAQAGALERLEPFLCARGADFYRLPRPSGRLTLIEEAWTVPAEIDGCVPLLAGQTLAWKIQE